MELHLVLHPTVWYCTKRGPRYCTKPSITWAAVLHHSAAVHYTQHLHAPPRPTLSLLLYVHTQSSHLTRLDTQHDCIRWAGPGGTAMPGQPVTEVVQAPSTPSCSKNQFNKLVSR